MNSKMIAIIAVVAMCGAALVGVGYAYSTSYEVDNDIDSKVNYIVLTGDSNGTNVTEIASVTITEQLKYDTKVTADGQKYVQMYAFDGTVHAVNVALKSIGNANDFESKHIYVTIDSLPSTLQSNVELQYDINGSNDYKPMVGTQIDLGEATYNGTGKTISFKLVGTADSNPVPVNNWPVDVHIDFKLTFTTEAAA